MKIIETIAGATENTVVYEDGNGSRITVTRPKIISIKQIVAEIESSAKPSFQAPAKPEETEPVPTEEPSIPENISNKAPNPSPNAGDSSRDINTPKASPGSKNVKK